MEDYACPASVVIGSVYHGDAEDVAALHRRYFPTAQIHVVPAEAAELVKLARNSFYALKVGFFNDLYDLANAFNVSYEDVRTGILDSAWVNPMHTRCRGRTVNEASGVPACRRTACRWSTRAKRPACG